MMTTAVNYSDATLVSNTCRNIKIFADDFTDDDHYLSTATNFPNIPLTIINEVLNGKYLTDAIDVSMGYLRHFI